MSMRVFLTGASGYLGGVLTEHLARLPEVEGITGIALTPPESPLPTKVKFKQMDIRSSNLPAVMAGHDVVIHTACVVLWPASMSAQEREDINQNGVRNVAKAALTNGVRRLIQTSSMAAYDPELARGQSDVTEDFPIGEGRSRFYYWNNKALAERTLSEILGPTSVSLTFLRPIYIVGPHCKVARSYRANAVMFPGHDPRRQFVHEDDVAAAFVQALRNEMRGPFNVVPDDFIRLSDVWRIVGARFVPKVPVKLACLITRLRWRWLGSPIHASWVEDMLVDFTGSNKKLKTTGWRPKFTSADALRAAVG